jgi:hypothetical protein
MVANKIEWQIKYLQELLASGETHVFALIYDRWDASGIIYGWNEDTQDRQVSLEEWEKASAILTDAEHDLLWQVQCAVEEVNTGGEAKTH